MSESVTRILFIDDDDLVLSAIRRVLRNEPYETYFTTDPEAAFRIVKDHEIDVVFSDHSMPQMSGVEFFAILLRLHGNVRRVMMTGHMDRSITLAAINTGRVERFIEKPWSNESLRHILRELDIDVRSQKRTRNASKHHQGSDPGDSRRVVVLQDDQE